MTIFGEKKIQATFACTEFPRNLESIGTTVSEKNACVRQTNVLIDSKLILIKFGFTQNLKKWK